MGLLYVVTPYLVITAGMVIFQRRLMFVPTKTDRLLAQDIPVNSGLIGDVKITAENGLLLHGWRIRSQDVDDGEPRFLVIYFSGNGGCRLHRQNDCRDFLPLGCEVLLFDYRGYGDNGGSPSETNFAADAQRIWTLATTELEYPSDRILLFGESLGGAVATRLAAELSVAGTPPAGLILNSTFASLGETVAWHYPMFPFQYFLWDRFPSDKRMPLVTCPVLQFHGTADEIVPLEHGQRLFAAAKPSPSGIAPRFVAIKDGQHNFISVSMMQDEIAALLRALNTTEG